MSNVNSVPEKVELPEEQKKPEPKKTLVNKRAKYNRVSLFDVILYVVMILFMACIIVPFLHVISISFSGTGPVMRGEVGLWPKQFTLQNYVNVLSDGAFGRAYIYTIFYTVVGTFLSLMTTAMAAYALARRKLVGHNFFSIMITITMFFSGGLIPTILTVKSTYGLDGSVWSQILPYMVSTWNLIIMRSFFVAYPKEIIESGEIDGLQEAGVFMRLVLPTSKAALATIGLYYAVAYWNAYTPSLYYLSGAKEKQPVMHLLQRMISSINKEDMNGTAGAESTLPPATIRNCAIMIVVTPIMCVYPFIQKYFVKGVMVGSVKG